MKKGRIIRRVVSEHLVATNCDWRDIYDSAERSTNIETGLDNRVNLTLLAVPLTLCWAFVSQPKIPLLRIVPEQQFHCERLTRGIGSSCGYGHGAISVREDTTTVATPRTSQQAGAYPSL